MFYYFSLLKATICQENITSCLKVALDASNPCIKTSFKQENDMPTATCSLAT